MYFEDALQWLQVANELSIDSSAKDKMLLEEAYRSNPKPDKQARQEIVDRVSLNEKEVQVRLLPIQLPYMMSPQTRT